MSDQSNRLLAMLNSATSPHPSLSPNSNPVASPPAASGGRGPSPGTHTHTQSQSQTSPPPPPFQNVTLQDLFKNLSSPPPPPPAPMQSGQNPSPAGLQQQTQTQTSQQNNLLGMLKGLGTPPVGVGAGVGNGGVGVVRSDESVTPTEGLETPLPGGTGHSHHQNLLDMFKTAGPTGATGPHQPIITHPQGISPPAGPTPTLPSPSAANIPHPPYPEYKSPEPTQKPASQPTVPAPSPATAAPKRSIFDFVSPFDAFDAPKSKGTSPAPSKLGGTPAERPRVASTASTTTTKSKAKPSAQTLPTPTHQQGNAPAPAAPGSVSVTSSAKASPATKTSSHLPSQVQPARSPSAGSSASFVSAKQDSTLSFLVEKVANGQEGKGPRGLGSNTIIDISKPNLEGLVSDHSAVQVSPVAKLQLEDVGFWTGRRVGMTSTYFAYALGKTKDRVRVINRQTGDTLLCHLPWPSALGSVVDIAATSTLLAVIGGDHSINVFRVPESWGKDQVQAEVLAHCVTSEDPRFAKPHQIEWVRKDGAEHLAIAGTWGVILIPASSFNGQKEEPLSRVAKTAKVLTTEGALVSFCVNQSHQAVGLLSSTGMLSLYNVATLNRVWHRQVPSSAPSAAPSSVQFCEASILVGRANNTHFDLVQITVDLAVLSTITFTSPSTLPQILNFAHAVYDPQRSVLLVALYPRGSVYAFKYALKGKPPVQTSKGEKAAAFSSVAEYPVEPILSIVLGNKPEGEEAEMFFATPSGFDHAAISVNAIAELSKVTGPSVPEQQAVTASVPAQVPLPASQAPSTVATPAKGTKGTGSESQTHPQDAVKKSRGTPVAKPAAKIASPGIVKTELPSDGEPETAAQSIAKKEVPETVVPEDLAKTLKKTEDRMITQFRQALSAQIGNVSSRLDSIGSGTLATEIASKLEKQVKANIESTVRAEIKRTIVPAVQDSVHAEMSGLKAQLPGTMHESVKALQENMERSLGTMVQSAIVPAVQQAVDRPIEMSIQRVLVPAIQVAMGQIADQVANELRSDILQIRKDLSPVRHEPPVSQEPLLRNMISSIAELQKQVSELSAQLAQRGPALPLHPSHAAHPSHGGPSAPIQPPPSAPMPIPILQSAPTAPPPAPLYPGAQAQPPSPTQLEDIFLTSLGKTSTTATLQLVNEFWNMTDHIFPITPGGKSPLSQAVLLTLLHRLALASNDLSPSDPSFTRFLSWERRVANLLDPRDPNISTYFGRVVAVVQGALGTVLQSLITRWAGEPTSQGQAGTVRQVLEIVGAKAQL